MRSRLLALAVLAGCSQAPQPVAAGAPDPHVTPGLVAPPQARLYAECISQAAETGSYFTERDGGTLRFVCTGDVANWFYDALGPWSAEIGSEIRDGGLTWRFTQKLVKDAYGVDNCSTNGTGDYQCVVILAVGKFIDRQDYRVPKH